MMGKFDLFDLRVRFARHALTDIITPVSPSRALQTLEVDSRAMSPPLETTAAAQ
jgi:hypothetical protein